MDILILLILLFVVARMWYQVEVIEFIDKEMEETKQRDKLSDNPFNIH